MTKLKKAESTCRSEGRKDMKGYSADKIVEIIKKLPKGKQMGMIDFGKKSDLSVYVMHNEIGDYTINVYKQDVTLENRKPKDYLIHTYIGVTSEIFPACISEIANCNVAEDDGISHFRIDLKEGSVDAKTGGNGYVLTCLGKDGDYMKEETLFAVAKTLKALTGKECYPRSGDEPWSWKGILTEEHIAELEKMEMADKI